MAFFCNAESLKIGWIGLAMLGCSRHTGTTMRAKSMRYGTRRAVACAYVFVSAGAVTFSDDRLKAQTQAQQARCRSMMAARSSACCQPKLSGRRFAPFGLPAMQRPEKAGLLSYMPIWLCYGLARSGNPLPATRAPASWPGSRR